MTEATTNGAIHLEDGDLLRYLDGESVNGDRVAAERHLAACEECRTRLETLERRSRSVSATLRAADVAPPPVRFVQLGRARLAWLDRSWLRTAALVVALLGGALTVSPVRAWLVDRWHEVRNAFVGADGAAPAAPGDATQGSGSVSFVPAPGPFTVRLTARQLAGTLRAMTGADSVAMARVVGAASGIDLVVLPDGIAIRNDSSAEVSYVLQLPNAVTELVVEVVGRAALRVTPGELRGGWSLDLGR